MKSNGNNLENPMRRFEIDLQKAMENAQSMKMAPVTQDFYDRMQVRDPITVYVITDSPDDRKYLGDQLIMEKGNRCKYLLGLGDHGEYNIFMNMATSHHSANLVPIVSYKDPQKAIDALHRYRRTGSYSDESLQIYSALVSYIAKEAGINETIISIIGIMGYRDDPKLQYLNERAIAYGVKPGSRDLPVLYKVHVRDEPSFPSLVSIYANIYDVFVLNENFKEYNENDDLEDLDLSDAITAISKCFCKFLDINL